MAIVPVTIAGRTYRMACGDGEEERLLALGRHVETTLVGLRKSFGEIGDQRLVIMTAISVTDELIEARTRIATLEARLSDLLAAKSDQDAARTGIAAEIALSIDTAAERLERLARDINDTSKI